MYTKSAYETGRIIEAKLHYQALLNKPKIKASSGIHRAILQDLGTIAKTQGQPEQAKAYLIQAIKMIEQQRTTIHSETGKIGFVGDKQSAYKTMIALLFEAGDYQQAFEYAERSKSRALVDMLASQNSFSSRTIKSETVQTLLKKNREGEQLLASFSQKKDQQTRGLKLIASQIAEDVELNSLVSVDTINIQNTHKKLNNNETLIEYYYQDE